MMVPANLPGGSLKFTATLMLEGKTATGIPVPQEVVDSLGAGKRPAVNVTINGYTYRSTVSPYNGAIMLPLSAEHRTAAGVTAGEEIEVELTLDTAPREVTVPDDFVVALAAEPAAKQYFESLSYSNKRVHVLSVEGAKTPETRLRRIEKAISVLRVGKG